MALGKTVQCVFLLLLICYNLNFQERFLNLFKVMRTDSPNICDREKRETLSPENATVSEILVGMDVADLTAARADLGGLEFPIVLMNGLVQILDLEITTECFSDLEVDFLFQCRCVKSFVWPEDRCDFDGCLDREETSCRCLSRIPRDGLYCQEPAAPVTFDLVVDLSIAASRLGPDLLNIVRSTVAGTRLPVAIAPSVSLTGADLTTVCDVESDRQPCQCERDFAWPSEKCESSGDGEVTCNTCSQIDGLPGDGRFCEPFEDVSRCSSTTTPATARTTPATARTTLATSPTNETVEITLDREFNVGFNDENFPIIDRIIQSEANKHIVGLISATSPTFRSGSTIISFNLSAPQITGQNLQELKMGLFNELSQRYPVIFDSPGSIRIQPTNQVFFKSNVSLECGPLPVGLNFGAIESVEWKHDGVTFDTGGKEMLAMPDFLPTDKGDYECLMKNENGSTFHQNVTIKVLDDPLIHLSPVRRTVRCGNGTVQLRCSVEGDHNISFMELSDQPPAPSVTREIQIPANCVDGSQTFTCALAGFQQLKRTITLTFTRSDIVCNDTMFGEATLNFTAAARCQNGSVGEITAVCRESTKFEDRQDHCVLAAIQRLLDWSELLLSTDLTTAELAEFLDELSNVTELLKDEVAQSPPTIIAIVKILNNVARIAVNTVLNETLMEDVILTAGVLSRNQTRESWKTLYDVTVNSSETNFAARSSLERRMSKTKSFLQKLSGKRISQILSVSSLFLQSLETITARVVNKTLEIVTPHILFNKTRTRDVDNDFVEIDVPGAEGLVTAVTFLSMDNVLPARDEANSSSKSINGRVVLVQSTDAVDSISFAYDLLTESLANPECVFWNFSLFEGLGGWDDEGCEFELGANNTFTCTCSHLTVFSILMSPGTLNDRALIFISFIGLGISMASLIICLIIEAIVWRKIRNNRTSYLRHVSIVNIAVSLLIADIWLIVGLTVPKESNVPVCIAATFFVHFFYLALFFWMFASALLLAYRTINVFGESLSKSSMLAIGFCLGYGCPVIIATITIAVTAPDGEYIRATGGCWLNWDESKALLAFVVPALLIVLINFIFLIIVTYKIWRSRTAALSETAPDDKHVIIVIVRSLAILTPLFGLTWALGVGTMVQPKNRGLHIAFSFFNSLQGFFILVFGTLLDRKVRSEMLSLSSIGTGTRSTSGGISSRLGIFRRKHQRDGYHTSSTDPPRHRSSDT